MSEKSQKVIVDGSVIRQRQSANSQLRNLRDCQSFPAVHKRPPGLCQGQNMIALSAQA